MKKKIKKNKKIFDLWKAKKMILVIGLMPNGSYPYHFGLYENEEEAKKAIQRGHIEDTYKFLECKCTNNKFKIKAEVIKA